MLSFISTAKATLFTAVVFENFETRRVGKEFPLLYFFYFKTRVTFSSSFFIICDDNINAFLIFIQRGGEERGRDDFLLLLFCREIIPELAPRKKGAERELKNAAGAEWKRKECLRRLVIRARPEKNELEADEKEFAFNDVWEVVGGGGRRGRSDCAPQSAPEKMCGGKIRAARGTAR
jgi:hypothetical protein